MSLSDRLDKLWCKVGLHTWDYVSIDYDGAPVIPCLHCRKKLVLSGEALTLFQMAKRRLGMGKVRDHIVGDAESLTQWVFRKLRNHDPMTVREEKGMRGEAPPRGHRFDHVEGTTVCTYRLADGRVFEINVMQTEGAAQESSVAIADH